MRGTVKDNLIAARKLIEKPENWIQHSLNAPGGKHCALGAICVIDNGPGDAAYQDMFDAVFCAMGGDIATFNDTHTHAEVLAAFDRAISESQ